MSDAAGTPPPFASREQVRTALVGVSEKLGDMALEGTAIGTVVVIQLADGQLQVSYTGITAPHAIGMLVLGKEMVLTGAMSGGKAR